MVDPAGMYGLGEWLSEMVSPMDIPELLSPSMTVIVATG
jgi:hypothetical protein